MPRIGVTIIGVTTKHLRRSALVVLAVLSIGTAPAIAAAPRLPAAPACDLFPASNVWNHRVDHLPVRADSSDLVSSIGAGDHLHPDFSSIAGGGYGIPYNVVGRAAPRHQVGFTYADESDAGPYPIKDGALIEGGSDRHLLTVDRRECVLYELFAARLTEDGWRAGSGAIWDLDSNALRPRGWTSSDAAGLPVLPGLVRHSEVAAGAIEHALRFTAPQTRRAFIYPARHFASDSDDPDLPPMGLRVRLKASVDISAFGPQSRILLTALRRYGMILADNGSPWFVTGTPDPGWDDDDLHELHGLSGSDFEAVDTSSLRNGAP